MARSLSQTLIRTCSSSSSNSNNHIIIISCCLLATKSPLLPTNLHASSSRFLRNQSSHSQNLDPNPPIDSETEHRETLAVQRIEDAIHRIIVRRSAPDWLPFRPGSSYWVPPRTHSSSSYGIADLMHNLANSLTHDEIMSLTTSRGWPSSSFYVHRTNGGGGDASQDSVEVETTSKNMPESEEEEG